MAERIQAVTFDVGGTLIDPHPSVGHIYAEIASVTGAPAFDPGLIEGRFRAAWKAFPRQLHCADDWSELVDQVFHGLVPVPPSQTFFPQLYARFAERDAWRVHTDVRPALEALHHDGIRTAVVSNWDERLRPLLRRLDLDQHFDPVIVSCEVGSAKPDPAIFRAASTALNLPPQQILHVGDDPVFDLTGAIAANFAALLINRDQSDCTLPHIPALTAIPDLLRSRHFEP
jgi:putative hydrolase of the HAD superfamily